MKTRLYFLRCCLLFATPIVALPADPGDSTKPRRQFKNVIRYNLSGPMLFGWDSYVVFGYERVIWRNHSVSLNAGLAKLPKLVYISTDLFDLQKDQVNTGFNLSFDYRFYPLKDNKHPAPRGVYIGPYFSFNKFHRENQWRFRNPTNNTYVNTQSNFLVSTVGFQLGYQFIFWRRITLDFVMIGPGVGTYSYEATIDANLDLTTKSDLLNGLEQIITQRYPGANFIFSEKHIDANGVMRTTSLGYRYLFQIGFNF